MIVLSLVLAIPLVAIAAFHVYWGLGGVWPGMDSRSCARAVTGFAGVDAMPGAFACFAVAAMIIVVTLASLGAAGMFTSPFAPPALAGATLFAALVFLGRGVVGFTRTWRRLTPEMPFARLDRKIYSPLCVALGIGLAVLAFDVLAA